MAEWWRPLAEWKDVFSVCILRIGWGWGVGGHYSRGEWLCSSLLWCAAGGLVLKNFGLNFESGMLVLTQMQDFILSYYRLWNAYGIWMTAVLPKTFVNHILNCTHSELLDSPKISEIILSVDLMWYDDIMYNSWKDWIFLAQNRNVITNCVTQILYVT